MPNRPSQPVSDPKFWKERLEAAKHSGRLHHSVYLAGDYLWNMIYQAHMNIFQKEIPGWANVLDIGCGYGRMAPLFQRYTGVDISPDLLEIARKEHPDKKFVLADLNKLPFKDKEFDVGFMVSVKAMIKNNLGADVWEPMERECKRVCKKVLVLEYGIHESHQDTMQTISEYEVLCDD